MRDKGHETLCLINKIVILSIPFFISFFLKDCNIQGVLNMNERNTPGTSQGRPIPLLCFYNLLNDGVAC